MISLLERKKSLNWVPGRPDSRRAEYAPRHRLMTGSAILPLVSFVPAWDQGQEGSCTGHGWSALIAHRFHVDIGALFMPSRQFLYYGERNLEGTVKQDNGAIVADGLAAIEKWGICPESAWPYSKKFSTKPSTSAYALAKQHLALSGQTVVADVDHIKQAIAGQHPVVGGFTVFESFMSQKVAETGIMPMPSRKEAVQGGHCVCWDGFDDKLEANGEKGFFFCRNSWGLEWGLRSYAGWFMMPYDYIKKNCSDFHVLTRIQDQAAALAQAA